MLGFFSGGEGGGATERNPEKGNETVRRKVCITSQAQCLNEAVLELALKLGAGDQHPHVQRHDAAVLKHLAPQNQAEFIATRNMAAFKLPQAAAESHAEKLPAVFHSAKSSMVYLILGLGLPVCVTSEPTAHPVPQKASETPPH